jgi:hypothetical protein
MYFFKLFKVPFGHTNYQTEKEKKVKVEFCRHLWMTANTQIARAPLFRMLKMSWRATSE